jgi:hypothetical protein
MASLLSSRIRRGRYFSCDPARFNCGIGRPPGSIGGKASMVIPDIIPLAVLRVIGSSAGGSGSVEGGIGSQLANRGPGLRDGPIRQRDLVVVLVLGLCPLHSSPQKIEAPPGLALGQGFLSLATGDTWGLVTALLVACQGLFRLATVL